MGLPGVGWEYAESLLVGALAVIFVGYSESLASARAMATKHGYAIDPNQELIAQGAACIGCRCRRRISDRRQSVEDLGGRLRRAADADGIDTQRRAGTADDAVPRLAVRRPCGRRARRDRHRRDDRSDRLR